MNENLKDEILEALTWLGELKNQVIEIEELISVNGENYDRHSTATSNISMTLKNLGVRFSGGIAMLQSDSQDYEFRIGTITAILRTDFEILVTEKLAFIKDAAKFYPICERNFYLCFLSQL